MKKKLLLVLVMMFVFVSIFIFAVSAETTRNESVTLSQEFILADGTTTNTVPLFDSEGNALIWYLNSGNLKSIRADNAVYVSAAKVNNTTEFANYTSTGTEVVYGFCDGNTMERVKIFDNGVHIPATQIVVFNIMDDGITDGGLFDTDGTFNAIYETHNTTNSNGGTNLEYAYLDTNIGYIRANTFKSCTKLKYVNLESLTALKEINGGGNFENCSSLFSGQVLDLSNTQLTKISGFSKVPLSGIKLPSTMTEIGGYTFNSSGLISIAYPENTTKIQSQAFQWSEKLTTLYLNNTLTTIDGTAFRNCPKLNTIFYVGTKAQFITLLENTGYNNVGASYGGCGFWPVVGVNSQDTLKDGSFIAGLKAGTITGNLISYSDYQKLTDKSAKYVVYDYSYCEAYNDGNHSWKETNACVKNCSVCGLVSVNHAEVENISVNIEYTDYSIAGVKATSCKNDGCPYDITEEAEALFTCLGYSAPEDGRGGIAIGYTVNNEAIKEYEEVTGKSLKYGVFAVLQSKLEDNDVFAKDGTVAEGVINAEITSYEFVAFELKIVGFTDAQKDVKLAMGAYVVVTDGETTEYSYLQSGTPNENEKYCFVSYNDIVGNPSTNEEVTQ